MEYLLFAIVAIAAFMLGVLASELAKQRIEISELKNRNANLESIINIKSALIDESRSIARDAVMNSIKAQSILENEIAKRN